MIYAQTNYYQLQGKTVNGVKPRYSIHDIGCFITSFANLMSRYGRDVPPDQLDNELAARNLYIDVDDGVYDDVGWSTICAYDPSIAISATGTGAPTSNDSIVKFVYYSTNLGHNTTHFSLVADAAAGTIIDSWDGQVKSWNVYGGPQAYASYVKTNAQPVQTVQGDDVIPDQDNYYWRFGQKTAQMIRGRDLSREEFQQNLVGKSSLTALEILEDDPEADATQQAQDVGQVAVRDNWQGQIAALQDQLATAQDSAAKTQTALDQVLANDKATKADLQAALQQVADANAKLQEANKKLEDAKDTVVVDQETKQKVTETLTTVKSIKGMLMNFIGWVKQALSKK